MRIILAIFLFMASLQAASGQAFITGVTGQPGSIRVNPNGATTVSVRWRVTIEFTGPAPETVMSASGAITTGGTLGGALSRRVASPGAGATVTVTLAESLFIDRTNAEAVAALGPGTYSRLFTTSGGTGTGAITARASSGGALAVRNLELTFDDGSRHRVIASGTPLAARLEVSTLGRGFFAGKWEISGPSGSASFRPLSRVSKRLSGSRKTVFESPVLRTDRAGIYRVRFIPEGVGSGTGRTPVAVISYSVVAPDDAVVAKRPTLGLIGPAPGQEISGATRFSWQSVPGAARYRLEFTEPDVAGFETNHLAAVEVAGTSTRLRGFTLRRLTSQQRLYWHVVAFDGAGQQIAVSPKRRLR